MGNINSLMFIDNPNPMIIIDESSQQILDVNEASIEKYGYSRPEFLKLNFNQLQVGGDIRKANSGWKGNYYNLDPSDVERHQTKTNQILYVRTSTLPIGYGNKKARLKSITDLTDIVRLNEQKHYHFMNSPAALIEWDEHFKITGWSKKSIELLGWSEHDTLGKPIGELPFIDKESLPRIERFIENTKKDKTHETYFEVKLYTKDGKALVTEWHNSVYIDHYNHMRSTIIQIHVLTEKEIPEKFIPLLSEAIKATSNGIVITNTDGIIEWVNPSITRLTGYSEEELIGQRPSILKSGKQDARFYSELWETIKSGKVWKGHLINRKKNGTTYYEEQTITPLTNEAGEIHHFVAIKQDISDRIETDKKIRRSLKEKETLLAEIHHRVKNNLALVSSLIDLPQFKQIDNKERQLLIDTQLRIKSIATVHEKLYHNELLSEINFKDFITDINRDIELLYLDKNKHITFRYDCDDVFLSIREAVPCGLILTELVINAYKYAFKSTKNGIIFISLHRQNNGTLKLTVKDNGDGIKDRNLLVNPTTLGFTLIKTLADQIDAKIKSEFEEGFGMTLLFKTKDNYTGK